jgi:CDP-glycerol glycerophosphotransferase
MAEKQMHGFRARLDYFLKHNYIFYKLFNVSASTFMRVWGWFVRIDEKMIIFSAHSRKYNDSPRTIYEYMYPKPQYKDYKYVWALEDPDNVEVPGPAIKVKSDTLEYFKLTLKAKYWITCVNIERSLHYKKKNCIYLNTWHGTAFNTIGNEAGGRKDYDFSHITYFCYESDFQKYHCMKGFNTREEAMIPTGYPRNDTLYYVTPEEVRSLKVKLGLPLDKKIVLYAPTWRDSTDNGKTCAIKPPINVKYWEERLKDDYIVLFRTHAYTNTLLGIDFNEVIRDYSTYPVVNDLFKVSDVLISDYSSCVTDYCILERPIICFAYDYEDYKATRGLNIDFETEMPSGIKKTEKEVIDHLLSMDYDEECKKTKALKDKYTYIGGRATEICVKKMFGN